MNRLQLAQRVHLLTGAGDGDLPGSRPTTTLAQTGDLLRIVTAVDESWRAIQTARKDWLFMQGEGTLPLVAGVQRYPLWQSSAAMTASVTGSVVTATVADTTGMAAGQDVVIADAVQTAYNGTFEVYDVPSITTFRYLIVGTPPVTPATGTITYTPEGGSPTAVTTLATTQAVVTLNAPAHDFTIAQTFVVAGATPSAYNGLQTPIAVTTDTLTYLVPIGTATPATGRLSLAASVSLADFDETRPYFAANRHEPYLLLYNTADGVSTEQPMHFVEPHDFEGYFNRQSFATSTGRPVYYTILPGRRIAVFGWPDVGYTARIRFRRRVQLLAADTDEPYMPDEFHPMIAYRAIMDFMGYNENSRQFTNAARMYADAWEDLCIQQLPRISSTFGTVA